MRVCVTVIVSKRLMLHLIKHLLLVLDVYLTAAIRVSIDLHTIGVETTCCTKIVSYFVRKLMDLEDAQANNRRCVVGVMPLKSMYSFRRNYLL